ncbi:MAG: VWA domain-containing protein [Candidatus Omnitrophota bacterium]
MKLILLFSFFALSIFSLMRPQWGFQWRQMPKQGVNFLIALDASKSMLSEDIKPNRLERSKLAIGDLVKKLTGDRVGLLVFTSRAFLQCPLTSDYSGFLTTLKDVNVNLLPHGGTSLTDAIKESLAVYKDVPGKNKILIVITDGENHEGDPLKMAQEAKNADIAIYCIGIGTREGDLIPFVDREGKKAFLKDKQGNVVKSHMNEDLLKKIALMTGGSYIRANSVDFGLLRIYEEKVSRLEKVELKSKRIKVYEDRFQIFLSIALVFLIFEFFIDEKLHDAA